MNYMYMNAFLSIMARVAEGVLVRVRVIPSTHPVWGEELIDFFWLHVLWGVERGLLVNIANVSRVILMSFFLHMRDLLSSFLGHLVIVFWLLALLGCALLFGSFSVAL